MPFPPDLQAQIANLAQSTSYLKDHHQVLSHRYRSHDQNKSLSKEEEALAYLLARAPATYAVGAEVLRRFQEICDVSPTSILDLGAGLGLTRWLFADAFPELKTLTLMERNTFMVNLGKKLDSPLGTFAQEDYQKADLPPHDLAFLSYTLSEILENKRQSLLQRLWDQGAAHIILIEPGTPHGFEVLRQARTFFLEQGGFAVAPCGHTAQCPMAGKDWCHFSIRIPRSTEHRSLKQGHLPYEDEKFSYLIMSRLTPEVSLAPRLIRKPIKGKGHQHVDLCTPEGLVRESLSKSKTPDFKSLSRCQWGDLLPRKDI